MYYNILLRDELACCRSKVNFYYAHMTKHVIAFWFVDFVKMAKRKKTDQRTLDCFVR